MINNIISINGGSPLLNAGANKDRMNEKDAHRILVLLYSLTDGQTDVPIDEDTLIEAALKVRLFEMSDQDFEIYSLMVLDEVNKHKNERLKNIN